MIEGMIEATDRNAFQKFNYMNKKILYPRARNDI